MITNHNYVNDYHCALIRRGLLVNCRKQTINNLQSLRGIFVHLIIHKQCIYNLKFSLHINEEEFAK